MYRHIGGRTDIYKDGQTYTRTGRHIYKDTEKDSKTDRIRYVWVDRHTDGNIDTRTNLYQAR